MKEEVVVHYLSLKRRDQLSLPNCPNELKIEQSFLVDGSLNRFFYEWVGGPWKWTDKKNWDDTAWAEYAKTVQLFIIYLKGTPIGYFELGPTQSDSTVELYYFGLAKLAIGRGLGSYSLAFAIKEALIQAENVTVNTCSWDHPRALTNYLKQGFIETHREIELR